MKKSIITYAVIVLFSMGYAEASWTTIDYPGAIETRVQGIDDSNLVGWYDDGSSIHGFLYDGTTWTTLDAPGAIETSITGIDSSNLVGWYDDGSSIHGFLYDGTTWITNDPPGAIAASVEGIDGGNIVGVYADVSWGQHGFLYDGTTWTTLDAPGASITVATDIDGGNIVGIYNSPGGRKSFLYNGTDWIDLNMPGESGITVVGIDGSNLVGYYFNDYNIHGFLYDGANWTTIDIPGATYTYVLGIDGDSLVGQYSDGVNRHGFVYEVPGPALAANPGDIYPDNKVDWLDMGVMGENWLFDGNTPADIDNNGDVNGPDFAILANNWGWIGTPPPNDMVWVYINDPGIDGNETFIGYMSKYETTNAQYCQFLNTALASGDITVDEANDLVYGANGSNSGTDFVGEIYFNTYTAPSFYSQITYSGGTFSVRIRDGNDMSNHPVVQVSWYGATAFCNYYGYRLPTEWEWQAVADYDGTYTHGCGTTIDHNKANYDEDNPLNLSSWPYTSPVNHYSSYGYGTNDMAGNVWEWTNSCFYDACDFDYRVIRGGSWFHPYTQCLVSYRIKFEPNRYDCTVGFRVCR